MFLDHSYINPETNNSLIIVIRSIDDSGLSIYFPDTSYEKSKVYLQKTFKELKTYHPQFPDRKDMEKIANMLGGYCDYW